VIRNLISGYIAEFQFTFYALRITPEDLSRYNCCTLSFTNKY